MRPWVVKGSFEGSIALGFGSRGFDEGSIRALFGFRSGFRVSGRLP